MFRPAQKSDASPAYVARIRKALNQAEASADATLADQLALMQSIVRARQDEEKPHPFVGQEALVRLGRAMTKQIEVGNDLRRAHAALRHDAVDVLMVSGEEDCPPPPPQGALTPREVAHVAEAA